MAKNRMGSKIIYVKHVAIGLLATMPCITKDVIPV
jgi:hypothetical protein